MFWSIGVGTDVSDSLDFLVLLWNKAHFSSFLFWQWDLEMPPLINNILETNKMLYIFNFFSESLFILINYRNTYFQYQLSLFLKIYHKQSEKVKMLGKFQLTALLLILTVKSQLNPHKMFNVNLSKVFSTIISPSGEIYFGGDKYIQEYSQDYYFLRQNSNVHSGKIINIFFISGNLVTVADDGQIVKWNPSTLQKKSSTETSKRVICVDSISDKLAVNYGTQILQFDIQKMQIIRNYTSSFGNISDISYSKADNGRFIYAITPTFKIRFNTQNKGLSFFQNPLIFYSIDSHPKKQYQILIDQHLRIQESDQFQGYTTYTDQDYILLGSARYSLDGQNVFSVYLSNRILVWEQQKVISQFQGWQCSIVDMSESHDRLCIVDACGKAGILHKEQVEAQVNIWAISCIASLFLIMFIIAVGVQQLRQRRKQSIFQEKNKSSFLNRQWKSFRGKKSSQISQYSQM